MSSENIIEIKNISKSYQLYQHPKDRLKQFVLPKFRRALGLSEKSFYQEFWALKDITFNIRRGETIGIIGRNGSGKSTLLQIACGVLAQTEGSATTHGRIAALLELGSGFNPEFTGLENVLLYASILGISPKEAKNRIPEILKFADIGEFINHPTKTYSSGMVVRLAFSTIIHMDPDILVVDEALAVGDTVFQQKCLNRIREMQAKGISILLVTHSTNTVIEYCDRAIYLKQGKLIADGPCREVVKLYVDDLVDQEGGKTTLPSKPNDQEAAYTEISETPNHHPHKNQTTPVEIIDVIFEQHDGKPMNSASHGESLKIRVRIKASTAINLPCTGVQISSVDGIILWSASSQSLETKLTSWQPGIHEIHWELKLTFGSARYIFAIGVGEIIEGEYRRYHRLDCAGYIDIIPERSQGSGWLAPSPTLSIQAHTK